MNFLFSKGYLVSTFFYWCSYFWHNYLLIYFWICFS